jgi:hypothetical protein
MTCRCIMTARWARLPSGRPATPAKMTAPPLALGSRSSAFGQFPVACNTLPPEAVQGLKSRHLVRLDAMIVAERPLRAYARLNVKHGPNVAQLVREIPALTGEVVVEFDLAYAKIDDTRIDAPGWT